MFCEIGTLITFAKRLKQVALLTKAHIDIFRLLQIQLLTRATESKLYICDFVITARTV